MIVQQSLLSLPDFSEETLTILPLERAETIPSSWYTDSRFHQFDTSAIFARTWQCVGRADQVKKSGDYFLASVADNPIMVIRGKDGIVRGFYNVCRHRGGPIVTEDGNTPILQCKYHGWTYLLDGTLRGVPRFDRVDLFSKEEFGLISIKVEIWEGLVFVSLLENHLPIPEMLEGIVETIAPISVVTKRFFHRVTYDIHCNWKVYVDNYLEGYHVPLVHPELFSLLDYSSYTTKISPLYSLQHSPLREGATADGATGGEAFYYFIFPNLMLNILPGRLQTNVVLPVDQDHCRVIFEYFYDDIESPEALKQIEEDLALSDRVQAEDIGICEHVQNGLKSIAYDRGRFSVECEEGVHHFQGLLKEQYRRMIVG